ncbi:MAG: hypothetical protein E7256_04020 [Lachnospiraceae bacterium]|nr:hypothetical protein [Lachnospiraceae bacterium]
MILLYHDRIIRVLIFTCILTVLLLGMRMIARKKYKIKFFLIGEGIMAVTVMVLGVCGYFGKRVDVKNADTITFSKAALQRDLNQLETVLFEQSPMYYADRESLREMFVQAKQQIQENMTEEEFYRLINPLVVAVRCGHTNLSISKALQKNREQNAKFLPLKIQVEGNRLFDGQSNERILSINGIPSEEIINTLLSNISHDGDNLAGAYYILNLYFPTKYYDFIEQPDEFVIQYQRKDGDIYFKVVDAEYNEEYNVDSWGLRMAQYAGEEYYSSAFSDDTATLRIKVFMEGKQSFSKFLEDFFAKVKELHLKKVVIDVRGNFGGDPRMAKELLSYLITQPFDYFKNDLSFLEKLAGYDKPVIPKAEEVSFESELLMDGACFSTCGHFAAIYQAMGLGIVRGEKTGGGSICSDGSKDIVLYQTGLRLHYATKVFAVNVNCKETNVVCPDEAVLIE